jgi:hypothetical protein
VVKGYGYKEMNDEQKYSITRMAIEEYYNNVIKDMPKEDLDLSSAQEYIDRCKEIKDWLDKLYNDNSG